MYLQIGWRNIWRNPRRTAVILMAVTIGVWSMIFLGALMRGIANQLVRNGIATLTGHIQVHRKGYRNDPAIENSMAQPDVVRNAVENSLPSGAKWAFRVRLSAVASNARHSHGVTMVGIDPGREAEISFIGQAVSQGRHLTLEDEHGIVVGEALLEEFESKLDRKLVLMSQDTEGEIASRAFRIVGVFRAETEATEKQFVFITLSAGQDMVKLGNGISEVSIVLPKKDQVQSSASALKGALADAVYEIHTWQELLPLVRAYLSMYDTFIFLWFLVVFIAMAFGIVNTTLMAVFERIREFGLLKALGMRPWWIVKGVLAETSILLILGMALGNLLGFLTVFALSGSGIDLSALAAGAEFFGLSRVIFPAMHGKDVVLANLVVLVLGLVVCLYPASKAARFTPVEALAHT